MPRFLDDNPERHTAGNDAWLAPDGRDPLDETTRRLLLDLDAGMPVGHTAECIRAGGVRNANRCVCRTPEEKQARAAEKHVFLRDRFPRARWDRPTRTFFWCWWTVVVLLEVAVIACLAAQIAARRGA